MMSQDPGRPRRPSSTAYLKRRVLFAVFVPLLLLLASAFVSYHIGLGQQGAPPAPPSEPGQAAGAPSAPSPTQPEVNATAPPQFPSIGLGRGQGEWEREHGRGARQGNWTTYENGRYWVQFNNNNIWHLDIHLSDAEAVPLPRARAVLSLLLPPDAKRISTYSPTEGTVVDVYQSDWLAQQYGNVVWPRGSRPGTLIVRNRVKDDLPDGNRVVWLGIAAGNDPAQNNP